MKRALLTLLLASACASDPAPISYGGGGREPAPRAERREPAPERVTREARPHPGAEPDWADGEGTPLSAYALRPEDAQPFDPANTPPTHRVGADESLYEIATRYQIPLRALIDQNNLSPPYALTPGRTIQLPPPRMHRVARGESFEDVARRYNVDPRSLALMNRMTPPYAVRPGDAVVLPALARAAPAPEPAPPPSPSAPAPPPPGGAVLFQWPVRGEVLARFGAQSDGRRVDGLMISSRAGESVGAAAEGDVVYAGSDLPAYGVLVLVRHADNYVTAYGYARRALVREGQRVRAGEAVAEAGERVLFQVRRGREAIDPAPLLGAN